MKARAAREKRELTERLKVAGLQPEDLYLEWQAVSLDGSKWMQPINAETTEVRLLSTQVYRDLVGAPLTGHAFDRAIPGLGKYLVTAVCWLFAFSTMISWSYYGEQGIVFLFGARLSGLAVLLYKLLFCALAIVASWPGFLETDAQLGLLADLGTGVMLFANVPIIVFMAPLAIRAFKDYFGRMSRGEMEGPHAAPRLSDVVEGKDVE
jgi:AGCS family alanine or glycine:cation symporter